ncbi:MAG: PepSY domain-containing protein [Steroidobacteraceae bacterium]
MANLPAVLALSAAVLAPVAATSAPLKVAVGNAISPHTPPAASYAEGISIDQAIKRAERQYRARVVRAETTEQEGRVVYVLRLLSDDGRVFVVRVAAASGAVL